MRAATKQRILFAQAGLERQLEGLRESLDYLLAQVGSLDEDCGRGDTDRYRNSPLVTLFADELGELMDAMQQREDEEDEEEDTEGQDEEGNNRCTSWEEM